MPNAGEWGMGYRRQDFPPNGYPTAQQPSNGKEAAPIRQKGLGNESEWKIKHHSTPSSSFVACEKRPQGISQSYRQSKLGEGFHCIGFDILSALKDEDSYCTLIQAT
jgi:hypothetical protein